MTDDELQKVRGLLDRMNEICNESQEIRAQLETLMAARQPWPDSRRVSRLFEGIPAASAGRTPPPDDGKVN